MFKYAKTLLDKGIQDEESLRSPSAFDPRTTVYEPPISAPKEEMSDSETPETVIGEHVSLKGTLVFEKLIRIDGSFEGEIESQGKIIVGPKGFVKANLNLQEAFIAGKVEGDITVKERLVLRGRAEVKGNITAPILSVDEGVSIIGQVYVTAPESPQDDPSWPSQ